MLKGSTAITSSPKKFQTESVHLEEEPILLKELESKEDYEKVSVNIKVLDPTTVPTGKKIQEVIIAGSSKCTLWEDDIGSLAVGSSYLLKKFHVREYASKKFISKAREESEIFAIYDIGVTASSNEDPQPAEIHSALIVGVPQLDTYKSCLRCKARVEPANLPLGRCSKDECQMLQRYNVCPDQLSAKLLFSTETGMVSLFAYGKTVLALAN